MNLSFSGHTKELTFKQLYEEYYAPFCLYAKRFIEDKDTREDIVQAVKGKMKVFVDGGIRNGVDVFKALALGADGVVICRPFVTAVFGGAEEGVETLINKIGAELEDTMYMCGADSLKKITRDMVR